MRLLLSWALLAFAAWAAAAVLPGVQVRGVRGAIVVAAAFGVVNTLLGWLLYFFVGVGTLGLGFLLPLVTRSVVDALVLKIVAALTGQLRIKSFAWALACGLLMGAIGTAAQHLLLGAHAHRL